MTDYEKLCAELKALTDGVPHRIANLANASALIYYSLEDLNWASISWRTAALSSDPFRESPPVSRSRSGAASAARRCRRGRPGSCRTCIFSPATSPVTAPPILKSSFPCALTGRSSAFSISTAPGPAASPKRIRPGWRPSRRSSLRCSRAAALLLRRHEDAALCAGVQSPAHQRPSAA